MYGFGEVLDEMVDADYMFLSLFWMTSISDLLCEVSLAIQKSWNAVSITKCIKYFL